MFDSMYFLKNTDLNLECHNTKINTFFFNFKIFVIKRTKIYDCKPFMFI